MATKGLSETIWGKKDYYDFARKGSLNIRHPSFGLIQKYAGPAKRILDIGCGEGTRLALIKNKSAEKIGVDVSKTAISLAKKKYPKVKFYKVGESLPFSDGEFDFVYSAFVLEHVRSPEKFLAEALRVLAKGGVLLLVAPNFGSPNRISPNSVENRFVKFFLGIKKDIVLMFSAKVDSLDWQKVEPKTDSYTIDSDTTIEPYLLSLERFLKGKGLKIVKASSLWSQEERLSLFQLPFRILGTIGLAPFKFWGPHLVVVGEKHV